MHIFVEIRLRSKRSLWCFFSFCLVVFHSVWPLQAQTDDRLTEHEAQIRGELIEAEKFRLIGFCDKAIPLYRDVLQNQPREATAMYGLARCYRDQGEADEALRWFKEAVEYEPQNPWFRRTLIDVLDSRGAYAEAARQAESLLQLQADNPDYAYLAAYYQARSGDYDKALKTLDRLQKRVGLTYDLLERKYLLLLDQGALKKAEKILKDYLAERPADIPAYFLLANLYRKDQDWKKAAQVYEKILRLSPNELEAKAGLAEVQGHIEGEQPIASSPAERLRSLFARPDLAYDEKMKAFIPFIRQAVEKEDKLLLDQGVSLARELLRSYPQEASAHAALADLLYGAERLKEAREEYARALQLKPGIHSVWLNQLEILQRLGDYQALGVEAEKAIDYFPNDWYFYYLAGRAHLAEKETEDAVSFLEEALPLSGKDEKKKAETLAQLAIAYALLGQKTQSEQKMQALKVLEGESPLWMSTKARLAGLEGKNLAKAIHWAKEAVEQEPYNRDFLLTLAWLLQQNGQEAEAEKYLKKAAW